MIGTYHEHMRARRGEHMSRAEKIDFGMQAYFMVAQMIYDDGFSVQARRTFPRLGFNFDLLALRAWIERMKVWFDNLSEPEQELFRTLEFDDSRELTQQEAA